MLEKKRHQLDQSRIRLLSEWNSFGAEKMFEKWEAIRKGAHEDCWKLSDDLLIFIELFAHVRNVRQMDDVLKRMSEQSTALMNNFDENCIYTLAKKVSEPDHAIELVLEMVHTAWYAEISDGAVLKWCVELGIGKCLGSIVSAAYRALREFQVRNVAGEVLWPLLAVMYVLCGYIADTQLFEGQREIGISLYKSAEYLDFRKNFYKSCKTNDELIFLIESDICANFYTGLNIGGSAIVFARQMMLSLLRQCIMTLRQLPDEIGERKTRQMLLSAYFSTEKHRWFDADMTRCALLHVLIKGPGCVADLDCQEFLVRCRWLKEMRRCCYQKIISMERETALYIPKYFVGSNKLLVAIANSMVKQLTARSGYKLTGRGGTVCGAVGETMGGLPGIGAMSVLPLPPVFDAVLTRTLSTATRYLCYEKENFMNNCNCHTLVKEKFADSTLANFALGVREFLSRGDNTPFLAALSYRRTDGRIETFEGDDKFVNKKIWSTYNEMFHQIYMMCFDGRDLSHVVLKSEKMSKIIEHEKRNGGRPVKTAGLDDVDSFLTVVGTLTYGLMALSTITILSQFELDLLSSSPNLSAYEFDAVYGMQIAADIIEHGKMQDSTFRWNMDLVNHMELPAVNVWEVFSLLRTDYSRDEFKGGKFNRSAQNFDEPFGVKEYTVKFLDILLTWILNIEHLSTASEQNIWKNASRHCPTPQTCWKKMPNFREEHDVASDFYTYCFWRAFNTQYNKTDVNSDEVFRVLVMAKRFFEATTVCNSEPTENFGCFEIVDKNKTSLWLPVGMHDFVYLGKVQEALRGLKGFSKIDKLQSTCNENITLSGYFSLNHKRHVHAGKDEGDGISFTIPCGPSIHFNFEKLLQLFTSPRVKFILRTIANEFLSPAKRRLDFDKPSSSPAKKVARSLSSASADAVEQMADDTDGVRDFVSAGLRRAEKVMDSFFAWKFKHTDAPAKVYVPLEGYDSSNNNVLTVTVSCEKRMDDNGLISVLQSLAYGNCVTHWPGGGELQFLIEKWLNVRSDDILQIGYVGLDVNTAGFEKRIEGLKHELIREPRLIRSVWCTGSPIYLFAKTARASSGELVVAMRYDSGRLRMMDGMCGLYSSTDNTVHSLVSTKKFLLLSMDAWNTVEGKRMLIGAAMYCDVFDQQGEPITCVGVSGKMGSKDICFRVFKFDINRKQDVFNAPMYVQMLKGARVELLL